MARDARSDSMLGKRGGIHAVNLTIHGEEALRLLTAVCAHNGARDLKRAGIPVTDYQPVIHPARPLRLRPRRRRRPGGWLSGAVSLTGKDSP